MSSGSSLERTGRIGHVRGINVSPECRLTFRTFVTRRWRILTVFGDHRDLLIRRGAGRFRAESISASNGYPTGVLIGTVTTRNKGSLHSGPILPFSSLSYPPYHNNHVSREERNSRMDRSRSYGSGHGHSKFPRRTSADGSAWLRRASPFKLMMSTLPHWRRRLPVDVSPRRLQRTLQRGRKRLV